MPTYHLAEGIDADVQSANMSIDSSWRKANRRVRYSSTWQHSIRGMPLKKKK